MENTDAPLAYLVFIEGACVSRCGVTPMNGRRW
jgi:hypothetical protein